MENITYKVNYYKDGMLVRAEPIQAKTKVDLIQKILSFIDVQWPAEKSKISYKIR